MENDESQQNQQQSEQSPDPWRDPNPENEPMRPEATPVLKNPDDTPTGELVADYEALLADIKVRKANQDDALKALDQMRAETVTAYESAVKGASVEAAKLLVVISKRLGMPLTNGAQRDVVTKPQGFKMPAPGTTECGICHKTIGTAGMGMHLRMHARRGDSGETLPRKLDHGARQPSDVRRKWSQSMSEEKCRQLLAQLSKYQPIGSREFSQRIGRPNQSAFFTGLKERGYASNKDGLWTVTPQGAALLHMQS